MSWNKSYASKELFEKDEASFASGLLTESERRADVVEQVTVARKVAAALIASGAVGSDDRDFSVNLAGHSNPDHQPASGWANDTITVTVSQK